MSKQQFIITGEEYVGYEQGNAYIISNGECQFSIWERKEDAQKVCDYLNNKQATIETLKKLNNSYADKFAKIVNEIMEDVVIDDA